VLRDQIDAHCETLAKLTTSLHQLQLPEWAASIGPSTLVVIDEAGMTDTLSLDAAVSYIVERGGSVRLIGDDQQLSAIGAGGVLRDIRATHGAARLTEPLRFTDPAEAAASLALREGQPEAIGFYCPRFCGMVLDDRDPHQFRPLRRPVVNLHTVEHTGQIGCGQIIYLTGRGFIAPARPASKPTNRERRRCQEPAGGRPAADRDNGDHQDQHPDRGKSQGGRPGAVLQGEDNGHSAGGEQYELPAADGGRRSGSLTSGGPSSPDICGATVRAAHLAGRRSCPGGRPR
jgi:hypothetical protein